MLLKSLYPTPTAESKSGVRVRTDLAKDVGVANDNEQSLGAGDGHIEPKSKEITIFSSSFS
jgi:hypothetical protein